MRLLFRLEWLYRGEKFRGAFCAFGGKRRKTYQATHIMTSYLMKSLTIESY